MPYPIADNTPFWGDLQKPPRWYNGSCKGVAHGQAAERRLRWRVEGALGVHLEEFLALCFPAIHAAIDWARPYRFLDTELQRATGDDQQGRRTADKLVEVWGRDGVAAWVLIHIEVQSQDISDFARRMFQYHYWLRDRFDRPVVSVAVLGDDRPRWRPTIYESALWGCEIQFRFPIVKLLDYQEHLAELEASRNPVASLVLAHLAAQRTRTDPARRLGDHFKPGANRTTSPVYCFPWSSPGCLLTS